MDFVANKRITKTNERTGQAFYAKEVNIFDADNGISTKFNRATFSESFVEEMIRRYFPIGSGILDPFSGSGTTIVACEKKARIGIGMEVSAAQVKESQKRLKKRKRDFHHVVD